MQIRIWKLGDLNKGLIPSEDAVQRLQNELDSWDKTSDLDLVWGEDISLDIYDTDKMEVIRTQYIYE